MPVLTAPPQHPRLPLPRTLLWSSARRGLRGPERIIAATGPNNQTSFISGAAAGGAVARPPATADGDLLVCAGSWRNSGGSITVDSGWVALGPTNTTNETFGLWAKPITNAAGEAASYTFTSSAGSGRLVLVIFRVLGADLTAPLDAQSALGIYTGTTSVVLPTLTAVRAGTLLLGMAIDNTTVATPSVLFSDAAMTEVTQGMATTGAATTSMIVSQQYLPASGATGTRTDTISPAAANSGGFLVTIAPVLVVAALDADAVLTVTAVLTAAGTGDRPAAAALTATAVLTAAAAADRPAAATLTGTAALTAGAVADRPAAASLTATAALTAAGTVTAAGVAATLTATATLTAAATRNAAAAASLTGTATLTAAGTAARPAAAGLTATAALTAGATTAMVTAASLTATATVTAGAALATPAAAALGIAAVLTAEADVIPAVSPLVPRPGTGVVDRAPTALVDRVASGVVPRP